MPDLPDNKGIDELTKFRPQDDKDSWERAVFFATASAALSSNILSSYIRYCLANELTQKDFTMTDEVYGITTKEILTLNLWLVLCEQCGPEVPEWFRSFIYLAFQVADQIGPEPKVKDVFASYSMESGPVLATQNLSMIVCHRLGLGSTRPDAALALADLILDCDKHRLDLLRFALGQSIMALDAWVADMKPQSI